MLNGSPRLYSYSHCHQSDHPATAQGFPQAVWGLQGAHGMDHMGRCVGVENIFNRNAPPPPPPTPGAGHLDVVWGHGGVSPARTHRNRGAALLPCLSTALKVFCQFPVGHPPRHDAGHWSDWFAGMGPHG